MQFEYDPERLIEEVKKRPGIWDYENAEYRARNMRYNLWNEVVRELVHTEIKMTKSEMRELEIQLQKKWKSIRDCFQKYIVNPKRTKRPYIYSKQLQFLLKAQNFPRRYGYGSRGGGEASSESEEPSNPKKVWRSKKKIKLAKSEEPSSEEEQDDEDFTNFENVDDNDDRDFSNDGMTAASPGVLKNRSVDVNHDLNKTDEFVFASVDSNQNKSDSDDPDKLFLVSLLPHLKSIPEEFKLNVKMELMQVLRNANYSTTKLSAI